MLSVFGNEVSACATMIAESAGQADCLMTDRSVLVPTALGWLVLGALAYGIARWRKWGNPRSIYAVLSAGALSAVLALTLLDRVTADWDRPIRYRPCDFTSVLGGTDPEALLNWLLLLPFTLFFVLATHRPLLACVVALATTLWIELAQSFFLLGGCQLSDVVSNLTGGIVGALIGAAIIAFRKRRLSSG